MIRRLVTLASTNPRARNLALAATLGATVYLMWQSGEPPAPGQQASELRGPAEPDGFVVAGEYRSWNEDGKLVMHITSPRIEQFDISNSALMTSPRARMFGEDDAEPWIIEAEQGSLMQNEERIDRKSTRLNSSHVRNSYAVFCLKKKNSTI